MYRVSQTFLAGLIVLASALGTGGCATRRAAPAQTGGTGLIVDAVPADPNNWAMIATPGDTDRLRRVGAAWTAALTQARPRYAAAIAREGALLDPAGALTRVAPSPGQYRCRVIVLGNGPGRRRPALQAFKPQTCFVQAEEKLLVLMKATGTALPGGRLWEDGDRRMIFLGAMAGRPGAAAPAYGGDARRDRAGIFERVGDFRWRLVTPWQAGGPPIEVMELVPEFTQLMPRS